MKVAFIGHKRVPSNEGGIERVVERQATGLKSLGYEPVLYNRSGRISSLVAGRPKRIKSYKGMRIVTVPAPGGAFGVPLYSFLSTVHAAATGSDVLFFHASGPCNMIRLAMYSELYCGSQRDCPRNASCSSSSVTSSFIFSAYLVSLLKSIPFLSPTSIGNDFA